MDATDPHAGFALGTACLWNRDLDRAQAEAERCLALEPNSAEGHLLSAHVQIFGGEGYVKGTGIERFYRDVRAFRIYEGTSQIHLLNVAKNLLR